MSDLFDDWVEACQEIEKLKSQLEREQKCVELAVSALEGCNEALEVITVGDYFESTLYKNKVEPALTKIKSLRDGYIL